VGAGATLRFARRLNIAVEGMALGERSATLSASLTL
jgi:hypothetical protein